MDKDEEGGENELERNVNYLHDIMEKKKNRERKKIWKKTTHSDSSLSRYAFTFTALTSKQPRYLHPDFCMGNVNLETPPSFTKTVLA